MTGCPPLVFTGFENEFVTTSTDIPGSMRMPFEFLAHLVVILNRGIVVCFYVFLIGFGPVIPLAGGWGMGIRKEGNLSRLLS